MAILEAYSRVLAQQAAPAAHMYQRLVAANLASNGGSDHSALAGLLRQDSGSDSSLAPTVPATRRPQSLTRQTPGTAGSADANAEPVATQSAPPGQNEPCAGAGHADAPTDRAAHNGSWARLFPRDPASQHESRESRGSSADGEGTSSAACCRSSRHLSLSAAASHGCSSPHRASAGRRSAFKRASGNPRSGRHSYGSNSGESPGRMSRGSSSVALAATPRTKTQWIVSAAAADIEARMSARGDISRPASPRPNLSPPRSSAPTPRRSRQSRPGVGHLLPADDLSEGETAETFAETSSDLPEHSASRAARASGSILTRAEEQQYKWSVRKSDLHMVERLGAGAYGEVWAGRWRRNDVAVKLLTRSEDSDHGKQDFLREMQLLSELRHPNIVRFLGACLDRQNMCILFEICERSLFDLLYKSGEPNGGREPMRERGEGGVTTEGREWGSG